jgi:hypothetical protein
MLLLYGSLLFSQVAINTDGSVPDNSAILDVKSTTKGVLIPRLTMEERNVIATPAEGLMIFCTNCGSKGSLSIFSGNSWLTFSPCNISAPEPIENILVPGQITWQWWAGAPGIKWNTVDDFYSATDLGGVLQKTEIISDCDTTFTRYVWAYNSCAVSPVTILNQSVPASAPETPTADMHIPTMYQITWNWNMVAGAIGYKWNTENNLGTATDAGISNTITETGLNCETEYLRYVWAYNECDYSIPVTLTQSTNECCGNYMTINHIEGAVAPVNKTVTYSTVTNVTGENSKCWITQNLGADHQATSVNDITEASAGWYWQFNRMQGYKHTGSARTPNTTWITSINENSDWLAVNDPCALLLGASWRLPTSTEWTNVDACGGWSNWNGPRYSALVMHTAGYIIDSDGSLAGRGMVGTYWSSSQYANSDGSYLYFDYGSCYMYNNNKGFGFTSRCLRD